MEYIKVAYTYNLKMPPRRIKVVDVTPEGQACDDNVLPEAIEDIPEPIEEQTPQPSHFSDTEEVAQVTQVTQPVSNIETVELVECPDCKKKMTNKNVEVFSG